MRYVILTLLALSCAPMAQAFAEASPGAVPADTFIPLAPGGKAPPHLIPLLGSQSHFIPLSGERMFKVAPRTSTPVAKIAAPVKAAPQTTASNMSEENAKQILSLFSADQ